jgi:mono/diheme cytochrome c family protein
MSTMRAGLSGSRILAWLAVACLATSGMLASAQSMTKMNPGGMRETGPGGMWDELMADPPDASVGMRIYRRGILPGDIPLTATRAGTAVAQGQTACANCHQRSGLGAREGLVTIPPVTGAALFAPKPGGRGAYTDSSLAAAIRDGVDADGRELKPVMPRYALKDDELAQLVDYLKHLAPRPSPGVVGNVVHLATVVGDDVPPARKQAMLDVMQAYVRDLNQSTPPPALRWELHVWPLSGTAQNRRGQLQASYARQPVLALVGGLINDTWLPVHEFCQREKVPCLFPNTNLPVSDRAAFYTLYFDKGSVLKAQILARYFTDHATEFGKGRIVQVLPGDWSGYEPAAALRQAMGRVRSRRVVDQVVEAGASPGLDFWRDLLGTAGQTADGICALILWGGLDETGAHGDALAGLAQLAAERPLPPIFLASEAYGASTSRSDIHLRDRLRFISTLDPAATASAPGATPWSSWMAAHHLDRSDVTLQANSYFVMSLLDEAVRANGGDFTPEHLIERIEYSAGSVVPHPLLPSLSLGMGQRFGTKGGYILTPVGDGSGKLAATDLLVP